MAGTAAFFLIAWFSAPPLVWFGGLAVLVDPLAGPARSCSGRAAGRARCWPSSSHLQRDTGGRRTTSSRLDPAAEGTGCDHQRQQLRPTDMPTEIEYKESFYRRVYELFPGQSFENTLILGAGSGSDTAVALAHGVPPYRRGRDRPEDPRARPAPPSRPALPATAGHHPTSTTVARSCATPTSATT